MEKWESLFRQKVNLVCTSDDPAHDILHFERVTKIAKRLAVKENADLYVVLPAAWLHDLVVVPKNSEYRSKASQMSADKAIEYLKSIDYPAKYFSNIEHCIVAHSHSAGIQAETIEAKIVQDADRLDAIGAIGLARCFITAGILKRPLYSIQDPFCESRSADDSQYTLDHFYIKLLKITDSLHTDSSRVEGKRRLEVLKQYLYDLSLEIT